jgi:very-short-patch-repair endonuclease
MMEVRMHLPLPTGEGGTSRDGGAGVRGTILRPRSNSPEVFVHRARQMRREDTPGEKKAWIQLKDRRTLGLKFRRQVPIDRYIVDFYCHEIRVIIEIDGGVHHRPGQAEWDTERMARLEELGYRVLRIANEDVLKHPEVLFEMIHALYPSPAASRHPLPSGEGL